MNIIKNAPLYTVSEFSNSIKKIVEENFQYIRIKGEISRPSFPQSGHIYFNLKDQNGFISAVIWKYNSFRSPLKPEEGLEVICSGKITTFSGQSKYQIIVDKIELEGEGALLKLLEERKKKLSSRGFFDEKFKKDIPFLPNNIAVITSPSGAVIEDILYILKERFPINVYIWPVSVQGENASNEISKAIQGFNDERFKNNYNKPDVIIIARGGGSLEDLWCFNDEEIVRSIFESEIPIISAIGHETDTTLTDLVSDYRAPTPTAAAEKSVPVYKDLKFKIENLSSRLNYAINNKLNSNNKTLKTFKPILSHLEQLMVIKSQMLDIISKDFNFNFRNFIYEKNNDLNKLSHKINKPEKQILKVENELKLKSNKLKSLMQFYTKQLSEHLNAKTRLLNANSYEKILERGFTINYDLDNKIITSKNQVKSKEKFKIIFKDGKKYAIFE